METIASYDRKMQWEQGRARAYCGGTEGCPGPTVSNVGHGPDGGGRMVVTACQNCSHRIRKAIPQMRVNDEPLQN